MFQRTKIVGIFAPSVFGRMTKPEYECVSKTDETDIKALNTDGACPTGYDKKEKK